MLDDDGDNSNALSNKITYNNVPPGSYSVTELVPSGFVLSTILCSDPDNGTTTDRSNGVASIDLDAGETVTCTYINEPSTTTTTTQSVTTTTTATTTTKTDDDDNDDNDNDNDDGNQFEGCTPGYWKNHRSTTKYPNAWPVTGYAPGNSFETIFGVNLNGNLDGLTLGKAVALEGGGLNALIRHAAAALLNAAHPDIDPVLQYDTTDEVIAAFQAAFTSGNYESTKNAFAASNENGCPISGKED
jgi:hypothetical protein